MSTATKTCFRCGGSVIREPGIDDDDVVETCLACGQLQPHREEQAMSIPAPVDWRAAALAEYRGILTELARVDDLRAKAAQLRKGLVAFGLANVPDLVTGGGEMKATRVKTSRPSRDPVRPWSEDDNARFAELRTLGKTPFEIASVLGRTERAVTERIRRESADAV